MANHDADPIHLEKKSETRAQYEIVWDKPSAPAANWRALRDAVQPWLQVGTNALGEAYIFAARLVIEQIETFEDRQAERKVRLRAAGQRALQNRRSLPGPAAKRRS